MHAQRNNSGAFDPFCFTVSKTVKYTATCVPLISKIFVSNIPCCTNIGQFRLQMWAQNLGLKVTRSLPLNSFKETTDFRYKVPKLQV